MKTSNVDMPAMPCDVNDLYNATVREDMEWEKAALGLTKREQFAMAAMQGLLSSSVDGQSLRGMAMVAIKCADALLAELDKVGGE